MQIHPHFQPYHAPRVVGDVLRWSAVPSAHLAHARDVLVWLPPGYHLDHARRYPVLYLHDGQNKFDPATSFAGEDWNVDGATLQGITRGELEPFLMVAIYNSPDRLHEYNPLSRGWEYGRFIVEELMPTIDSAFRTEGGRRNAIMGSSMGGLISMALFSWYAAHFFGAACLSPSLWVLMRQGGPRAWLEREPIPPQPARLYLDHGTRGYEGRGAGLAKDTMAFFKERGFPAKALNYHVARGGDHNEASWRARVHRPLTFLFGKK